MQTIGRFGLLDALGQLGRAALYEAYDPNLDRRVELHVLAAAVAETAELESFGERASTWSRVAHPNVARVHEIGTDELGVFVAVEVGRETVEQWCEGGEASFERLVTMFDDALAGLAAAHGAGLVHGAVDGQSLFVSREGRAKLSRFKLLAQSVKPSPSEDVVALCKAFLRYAERTRAPSWFATLLREGLHDVDSLRAAVARRVQSQSGWIPHALVASVALATVAIAWRDWAGTETVVPEPCTDGAELLAEVWGPQRKAEIEAAIMATDRKNRVAKWEELEGRFDQWTEAWRGTRGEACDVGAAAEADVAVRQATLACLDARRMQLDIMSEAFAEVDDDSFGALFGESRVLPRPESCSYGDDDGSREIPSEAALEVTRELARAYALVLAQRVEEAASVYREIGPRAEAAGDFLAATEAYRTSAATALDRGDAAGANLWARRSLFAAEQSRDPVMIVRAWHRLADNAWRSGDVERAEFFIARALARSEDDAVAAQSRLALLTFEAQRLAASSRRAEAAELYVEAHELVERNGMDPLVGLKALFAASQTVSTGDRERGAELAQAVVEEGTSRYGPHHWIVAMAQAQLAQSAVQTGDYAVGLQWSSQAILVEPGEAMFAQAKMFATLTHADLLRLHGRLEEGKTLLAETVEELGPRLASTPHLLRPVQAALAGFATEAGRPCEAADAAGPVVAQMEADRTTNQITLSVELLNLADAQSLCGRAEQGLATLERGLAIIDASSGLTDQHRLEEYERSATIFQQLGEPARAVEALDRALSLAKSTGVDGAQLEAIREKRAEITGSPDDR